MFPIFWDFPWSKSIVLRSNKSCLYWHSEFALAHFEHASNCEGCYCLLKEEFLCSAPCASELLIFICSICRNKANFSERIDTITERWACLLWAKKPWCQQIKDSWLFFLQITFSPWVDQFEFCPCFSLICEHYRGLKSALSDKDAAAALTSKRKKERKRPIPACYSILWKFKVVDSLALFKKT